jgi:hypothetical protein
MNQLIKPSVHQPSTSAAKAASAKYLKMHLDRNLTWEVHIRSKCKQIKKKTTQLYWMIGRDSPFDIYAARFTSKSPANLRPTPSRARNTPSLVTLHPCYLLTPKSAADCPRRRARLVSCENGAIRPAQSIVAPGQIIIGFACVTVPVDITAAQCFVVVISILPIYLYTHFVRTTVTVVIHLLRG